MLVDIITLLLQFEKCIVIDICDTLLPVAHTLAADIFFTFPPAGPQTKGLVKQQAEGHNTRDECHLCIPLLGFFFGHMSILWPVAKMRGSKKMLLCLPSIPLGFNKFFQ